VFKALSRAVDTFRGSGEATVTVPPMDGALSPNSLIEEAPLLHAVEAPDNLTFHAGAILLSSKNAILKMHMGGSDLVAHETLTSEITCLASHPSGLLAAGLAEGRVVVRGGAHGEKSVTRLGDRPIICATAASFETNDTLLICLGSQKFASSDWKHDLMSKQASGSVWRLDLVTLQATCLLDDLAFPNGIQTISSGEIAISESWQHRLIAISPGGNVRTLFADLPGYPARIAADVDFGFWLAVFAPRTQLVEFVLREEEYRKRMVAEINPEYWISPSLRHAQTFLEPLQGGALKQLGELKPWAPSRSYGLVVRFDAACRPLESFHSRANGTRHGINSCVSAGARLIVAAKGGNALIAVKH
jgi:hypothetical protein